MDAPVRAGNGANVYLRDIGIVENGTDIVTGYAHVNGKRTVYIPVTKRSDASTLAVIDRVKAALPAIQAVVPEDVKISLEFDQSRYVVNAIRSLINEGVLGAVLTGLMVLLFPARLAQRPDRDHDDPFRAALGRRDAVGSRTDHQHHDARRTGACRRRAGR